MRLTLRTMLAYMDDVLEPADADILGKKIEESDFASGLLDRIRGVLRKLRIDAPRLDGKGMGNDANTVAEYLDSTLPQDRVAEFERVCLESDKHLCEVAACHQILTLVLGKPADVEPQLRQRIYGLAHAGTPAAAAAAPPSPPPVAKANGHAAEQAAPLEVPEYLRSGRQTTLWPLALVTAAALLLALGALWFAGAFSANGPLAKMLASRPVQSEPEAAVPKVNEPAPDAKTEQSTAAAPGPSKAPSAEPPAVSDNTANAVAVLPSAEPITASPAPATSVASTGTAEPVTSPPTLPSSPATAEIAVSPSPPAVPETSAPVPATADASTAPLNTAIAAAPVPPPAPAPIDAAPRTPMEAGRYTSDGLLTATLNASDGFWYPKQSQEILNAGERIVVLPPYRPQIALPSAVTLTFAGEGALQMAEPSDLPVPRVLVAYGRFVAATAGKPGAQVELDLAGIRGMLTLVDADSVVAVKVIRWIPPGSDPEATEGVPVVEMYNANGRAAWQESDKSKVEIPARHVHVYYSSEPPETHGPFLAPEWIDSKNVKPIERDAGVTLERMISPDRPLNLTLQEVMKDRRVEMRALAARCLAALDDFEPALRELSDPNQYSFWNGEFEALRQSLSRGKETAARLRETISLLRPMQAKEIYRLLWGYSEAQLEMGGAAELVRLLESDQMDVRVLSHLNLVSITGAREFYRPERPPTQMKTAIQSWRDRLSKGVIIYRLPPSPLDVYKPIAPPAGADTRGAPPAGPATPAAK
jgi:hypothetical protein